MKKMTPGIVGLSLLAAGEVPNFYSAPLPSYMTIRRFAGRDQQTRDETTEDIRYGERVGTINSLLVGIGTSILAEHPLPLIAVLVMIAIHVLFVYEKANKNPHPSSRAIDQQPGY